MQLLSLVSLSSLAVLTLAQDPASGWMAYAVGAIPSKYERITRMEFTWKVSEEAKRSYAFYSPWFGADPADNLNLIQPVNPWSGSSWSMYTEYFQWSPTHNSNSKQHPVKSGQHLHGSFIWEENTDSYNLTQSVVETGVTSQQTVTCQAGKKYTVPYVVYEKTFPCAMYPPDEIVTFYDLILECDGVDCREEVQWEAKVKDPNCDMTAVINNSTSISITWNTKASSSYDNMTKQELIDHNNYGWLQYRPTIEDK